MLSPAGNWSGLETESRVTDSIWRNVAVKGFTALLIMTAEVLLFIRSARSEI